MKASFNSFIVFFVKKRRLFLLDVSFSDYQQFANQAKYIKYKKKTVANENACDRFVF